MNERVCEWEGCEVKVTGKRRRCSKHQREHRRTTESARKRQARNADKCGQAVSAFSPGSPDDDDAPGEVVSRADMAREGKLGQALKRYGLPDDLFKCIEADPAVAFEHAETFAKMRREDPPNWERTAETLKGCKVRLGVLERAMGGGDANGDGRQGRPVEWKDPEPWPDTVDGAALLGDIAHIIQCHVSIAPALADTVALWIGATWIHDRLEVSPFLNVTSATKRCGKSLLLEVLGDLVRHPLPVGGRVTASALFRTIELYAPTMLLDEADTFLGEDDELRGVVNGSQRRSSAYVLRCVGDDHEPRRFMTWCPKAIAGIGGLPDTVLDRSIIVNLARRPPGVSLKHWRDRDRAAIENLRRQLARWFEDEAPNIVAGLSAVTFPPGLHDRGRDAWEALLAIGNAAGDDWAADRGRAWKACKHVMGSMADEDTGAREMLLIDLRAIFLSKPDSPPALGSKDLLDALTEIEGRPWSEWKRGKPLSARGLASLLKPFGVKPRNHRLPNGTQGKAYFAEDLEPHWKAYLGQENAHKCGHESPEAGGFYPSRRPNPSESSTSSDSYPSQGVGGGTDTNRQKASEIKGWDGGTDRNGGAWGEDAPEPSLRPPARPGPNPGERRENPYRKAKDGE